MADTKHWIAIDRYPHKPNGDRLVDERGLKREWYEAHPEAWDVFEVVPAEPFREVVQALEGIAHSTLAPIDFKGYAVATALAALPLPRTDQTKEGPDAGR